MNHRRYTLPAIALLALSLAACSPKNTGEHTPGPRDTIAAPAAEETPETTYADPTADDFTITLRTLSKQCFGSAGCNVTVEPVLEYTGAEEIDPDKIYEITYEITGDEYGPVIETMELTDQDQLTYHESSLSTRSSRTEITVKITDIRGR